MVILRTWIKRLGELLKRIVWTPKLVVFLGGLILFSLGLALAWLPLGLIGPGAILMGITLFGGGTKQ